LKATIGKNIQLQLFRIGRKIHKGNDVTVVVDTGGTVVPGNVTTTLDTTLIRLSESITLYVNSSELYAFGFGV
jgi:hypothetical protein